MDLVKIDVIDTSTAQDVLQLGDKPAGRTPLMVALVAL